MKLHYKNITISGGVAAGKGTLCHNLRVALEPLGWKFRSGGEIMREYVHEYVHPISSLADDDFHRALDAKTVELLEAGNIVVESWLAGFLARERADTLRIFMYCSNDAIRIDRVMNRDKVTADVAKKIIKERENNNHSEWKRLYGNHDFWDPKIFHIHIDTYSNNPSESAKTVLHELGYKHPNF